MLFSDYLHEKVELTVVGLRFAFSRNSLKHSLCRGKSRVHERVAQGTRHRRVESLCFANFSSHY